MITEKELIEDIGILKKKIQAKVDSYNHLISKVYDDDTLWVEINERFNEIISLLKKCGHKIK